ncbi:MAG: hypothetical protein AAGI17_08530 [Planctomycetota bacterium]
MAVRFDSASSIDGPPEVWLAAFGKHPGWNDHIDDQGLETELLVRAKRMLYSEGIGGVINAGTWDAMPEDERLPGFDHTFVWRNAEGLLIGRMWSSSDGKGRKKYPMVLCAQTRSLPLSFACRRVLPRLHRLEQDCKDATESYKVISLLDEARRELNTLARDAVRVSPEVIGGTTAMKRLHDADMLGPDGVGLRRTLYQFSRDFGAYLQPDARGKGESGSRSRSIDVRPQHIRVERVFEEFEEAAESWMRVAYTKLDPVVPLLVIEAAIDGKARSWLDLIAGEPTSTQLQPLMMERSEMSPASDVDYTIGGEQGERVDSWIESGSRGELPEYDPGHVALPRDRLVRLLGGKAKSKSASGGGLGPKLILIAVGVFVVIAAVLAAVVLILLPSGEGSG